MNQASSSPQLVYTKDLCVSQSQQSQSRRQSSSPSSSELSSEDAAPITEPREPGVVYARCVDHVVPIAEALKQRPVVVDKRMNIPSLHQYDHYTQEYHEPETPLVVFLKTKERVDGVPTCAEYRQGRAGLYTCSGQLCLHQKYKREFPEIVWIHRNKHTRKIFQAEDPVVETAKIVGALLFSTSVIEKVCCFLLSCIGKTIGA